MAPSRRRAGRLARRRCIHSGVRRPGRRRGSSRARAAASRKRAAKRALSPASSTTSPSTSSGSRSSSAGSGASSASGKRRMMPSSDQTASTSQTVALAQPAGDGQRPGGVDPGPEGGEQHQAPVADLVAVLLDDDAAVGGQRAGGRLLLGEVLDEVGRRPRVEVVVGGEHLPGLLGRRGRRSRLMNAPMARPVSSGRPGVSPFQKGRRGAVAPGAGATTTRSAVISAICQVEEPRTKVSPTRLS